MGLAEAVELEALKALDLDRAIYGSPAVAAIMRRKEEMERLLGPRYDVLHRAREALELRERVLNPLGLTPTALDALKGLDTVEQLRRANQEAETRRRSLVEEQQRTQLVKSPDTADQLRRLNQEEDDRRRLLVEERAIAQATQEQKYRELGGLDDLHVRNHALSSPAPVSRPIEMPDFSQFFQPVLPRRKRRRPQPAPTATIAPASEVRSRWGRFTAFVQREAQERGAVWAFLGFVVSAVLGVIAILLTL